MLIESAPLKPIAEALRSGDEDLSAYIDRVCDRLDAVDSKIEAFLPEPGRRERLQREAAMLEDRYPDPTVRPPLYGVPIGVKDIFNTEGFLTRAGSSLPPEILTGTEATAVTVLKRNGALVLGKAVTTEFAYFEPGPTRNPYNLEHTPGGSSSGSAAAVAAGICPLAFGSQTGGSINRPAAYCGVVGLKPSFGRISRDGVIPISESLDHVGLFTQDVEGMMIPASLLLQNWQPTQANDDSMPILGVPEGAFLQQTEPAALEAFEQQLLRLQTAGYPIKRIPALDDMAVWYDNHMVLMAAEMAEVHVDWFVRYTDRYRPRTGQLIRNGQTFSIQVVQEARKKQGGLRRQLETQMTESRIDLWVCPAATGPAPHGIGSTGTFAMNFPWTQAGLPSISLPAGYSDTNLPLGLQCVGRFNTDEQLLSWSVTIAEAVAPRID